MSVLFAANCIILRLLPLLTKYKPEYEALSVDPSPVLWQLISQCSCRFVTELCRVYMTVLADADTDQVDSTSEATSDSKKTISKHATLQYRDTLSARAETWHGQWKDSHLKETQTEQKETSLNNIQLLVWSMKTKQCTWSLSLSLSLSVCPSVSTCVLSL